MSTPMFPQIVGKTCERPNTEWLILTSTLSWLLHLPYFHSDKALGSWYITKLTIETIDPSQSYL